MSSFHPNMSASSSSQTNTSLNASSSLNSSSSFDEQRWVINIRRTLDEEVEEDNETPVNICNVPKSIMAIDPDSYIPQQIAIGPYHHWRPEVYEMERYKLAAAKRIQKELHTINFQHLVDQFTKYEHRIRASYHKFLNFSGETLAWMMAVDASFLLEFLQICAVKEGKILAKIPSRMSHLVDISGQKSTHNAILRDLAMLENQIPLFIIRRMIEQKFSPIEVADDMLFSMLIGFFKELSPFKMAEDFPKSQVKDCAHLLDFVYHILVPKLDGESEITEVEDPGEVEEGEKISFGKPSYVKQLLHEIWEILVKMNKGPVHFIKRIIFSKPMKVIVKLPWTIVSNIPVIKIMKEPVEYFFSNLVNKEDENEESASFSSDKNSNKPPLMEEITIPSVTELNEAGVRFMPTNEGITSITFDEKTFTFHLPIISLDVNSKVVLRNLVAYETGNGSGPLVLTRYTELMNGIIDTDEDAKFLREKGIIINRLKSDEEVANLWNGMSRSVKLTKVPFLDKVIEDVNKYYNGKWKVKTKKFMKRYIFGSWQILTFLAAILLLLLMTLQAFCSVYTCSRFFHIQAIE